MKNYGRLCPPSPPLIFSWKKTVRTQNSQLQKNFKKGRSDTVAVIGLDGTLLYSYFKAERNDRTEQSNLSVFPTVDRFAVRLSVSLKSFNRKNIYFVSSKHFKRKVTFMQYLLPERRVNWKNRSTFLLYVNTLKKQR